MRKILSIFPFVLLAVLLVGCGGGGGSSSNLTTISVITDWSNRSASTQSERITVSPITTPGASSALADVNAPTGASQTTNLTVSPGQYWVHIDLYSQQNSGGTLVGMLDAVVDTSVSNSVPVSIGRAVTSIKLYPTNSTLQVGSTVNLYASPIAANGSYTFIAPGVVNFLTGNTSILGVSTNTATNVGSATAVATGSTTITAQITSLNLSAQTSITLTPVTATKKAWTILVYMNASNDLWPDAMPNYLQMQKIASGSNVNIVVQWKESAQYSGSGVDFDGTHRYLVQPSTGSTIAANSLVQDLGTGTDMGKAATLTEFIAWAKANYPADHYCLDMWDHGDGWQAEVLKKGDTPKVRGISYDYQTGNHIDVWQMDSAIGGALSNLDVLAYDACLMQMLECGYQVRNVVHYIVCSEDNTPAPGYNYTTALAPFFSNPTGAPATLAQGFVDANYNDPRYTDQVICQSVVEATQMPAVATAVSNLADALIANQGSAETTYIPLVRGSAHRFDNGDYSKNYYDLYDVCAKIKASAGVATSVVNAATAVQSAVSSSVLYNKFNSNSPNSYGLAIDFSSSSAFSSESATYDELALAQNTDWATWLSKAP
jgi:hypothetical protein